MTHRTEDTRERRLAIVAALYHERPPPGASPEVMACWVRQRADQGQADEQIAVASGFDVQSIRRIIAERSA